MYIWSLTDIGSIAQRVTPDQGESQKQAEYIRSILIHHCLHKNLLLNTPVQISHGVVIYREDIYLA